VFSNRSGRIVDNRTRVPNELALRFNADAVVHGTSNPLLAAEVALGRLDRNVREQKLNLFLV
jgi:hypothetical protein